MMRVKASLVTFLPGLIFLLLWQLTVQGNAQHLFFFSAPDRIAATLINEMRNAPIWLDIAYTGFAALSGLVLGTFAGTALGIGLWSNPLFSKMTKPYIAILGAIPVFSLAPVMILWFGVGLWSKIVMAGFAVFLVATSQAYDGASQIANRYLLFARSLGVRQAAVIRHIILPGSLDWIKAGARMNVGFALLGTFIAEFISSEQGLGHYILKAGSLYDMPRVFAGIILMAVLSLVMERLAMRLTSL